MFRFSFQSLNDLFLVLETDTSDIELPRIATFMQKVGQCMGCQSCQLIPFSRLSNCQL